MLLNEMFLSEAPIEDFTLLGNWERSSSFRHEQDRKLLTNPKAQAKIIHKWRNTEVPFNMYFVNSPEANRHTEIGEVTPEWLAENMPKTFPELKLRDDAVNIIFTNNKGDERAPMTAWIIAHRLGHAVSRWQRNARYRQVPEFTEARSAVFRVTSEILRDAYGCRGVPGSEAEHLRTQGPAYRENDRLLTGFYEAIGTFRSARERNIRNEFEFLLECLAQYITTGKVRFNPLPDHFRCGRRLIDLTQTGHIEREDFDRLLAGLANELNYWFRDLLQACVGRIFVM